MEGTQELTIAKKMLVNENKLEGVEVEGKRLEELDMKQLLAEKKEKRSPEHHLEKKNDSYAERLAQVKEVERVRKLSEKDNDRKKQLTYQKEVERAIIRDPHLAERIRKEKEREEELEEIEIQEEREKSEKLEKQERERYNQKIVSLMVTTELGKAPALAIGTALEKVQEENSKTVDVAEKDNIVDMETPEKLAEEMNELFLPLDERIRNATIEYEREKQESLPDKSEKIMERKVETVEKEMPIR